MKIIYFLTWAIFTTQLFAMYNNPPRQQRSRQTNCSPPISEYDCPLPRSQQQQQQHCQNNVQCNNIETNNEINATNINIANPIKQDNEIKSHQYSENQYSENQYSEKEIEEQRKEYYKNNPIIEIKTEEYLEYPEYPEYLEYAEDLKERIKYIVNEGTAKINEMILSSNCQKEQKNLIDYAIRTYLRAAAEANKAKLYEIEAELYFKALEKEEDSKRQLSLLYSIKYSIFQKIIFGKIIFENQNTNAKKTNAKKTNAKKTNAKDTNAKDTNAKDTNAKDTNAKDTNAKDTNAKDNLFYMETFVYNRILNNVKECDGKKKYIEKYQEIEKKFKDDYKCPEIYDRKRIVILCNAYNIYNYRDDYYDEYTQLNSLILNKKNLNLLNEYNNNECNDNECNNIETNNEINSHIYSSEEIEDIEEEEREKCYEVNQENKTDKNPEDKMYKKETNPFLFQPANLEEEEEIIEQLKTNIINILRQ